VHIGQAVTNFAVSEAVFVIIQSGYAVISVLVIVNGLLIIIYAIQACTKLFVRLKMQLHQQIVWQYKNRLIVSRINLASVYRKQVRKICAS
jgi:hypothetical protein